MNLNKLTKAQLLVMIIDLQDQIGQFEEQAEIVREAIATDSVLPWEERKPVSQVQAKTATHAEIMLVRMAAAKAEAMSTGRAVKA